MGVDGQPTKEGEKIAPVDADGMPVMSIGFMVPVDQAVIWRGPMLHSAVTQFLRDTEWGELDYLIIDMPPGTGDVALTLSQLMPATGAVIVCTPQKVALLDAIKALSMFDKVKTKPGDEQSPVYQFLTTGGDAPKWNFSKYLVDGDGKVLGFYPSNVTPDDLRPEIEKALSAAG